MDAKEYTDLVIWFVKETDRRKKIALQKVIEKFFVRERHGYILALTMGLTEVSDE